MEFKDWCERYMSNKENLLKKTLEGMLEDAFIAGMKFMEEQTPLIGRDLETGELVELPREDTITPSVDKVFISDEELEAVDFGERLRNKNAPK
jgi:hypothetical protein